MKKCKLIVLMAMVAFSVSAQNIDATKVPEAVKSAFTKAYPNITKVQWSKEDGKYEASFKKDGNSMSTLQDEKGVIQETEMDIKISELPASASAYVKENYKGKSIKEASRITSANGEITYEAEVAGKDLIFDASGKFIKVS